MKKTISYFLIIILILPLTFLFVGCKKSLIVQFDGNGGSEITEKINVKYGEKITEPDEPVKDGYEFDGWYLGNDKWNFAGFTVTENMTLQAKWKTKIFVIDEINNKIIGLTSYGKTLSNLEIPAIINDISIYSIGVDAFCNNENLESILISNNLKNIESGAFFNCCNLKSIIFESNSMLESIEKKAFYNCTNLSSIIIPNGVTKIESSTFYNCSNLINIELPNSITSIGSAAFCNCSSLVNIELPSELISIDNSTFYNCSSLTYNLYKNGKYLGNSGNPYLVLVKAVGNDITYSFINEKTKFIYSYAFNECNNLSSVIFENKNGWKAGSTDIQSSDLESMSTSATFLTSTYCSKFWTNI